MSITIKTVLKTAKMYAKSGLLGCAAVHFSRQVHLVCIYQTAEHHIPVVPIYHTAWHHMPMVPIYQTAQCHISLVPVYSMASHATNTYLPKCTVIPV